MRLLESAGYLARFLSDGGTIAWGAVSTEGPIAMSAERPWRKLSELWCELVQRGADPASCVSNPSSRLSAASELTPQPWPSVCTACWPTSASVSRDQATATRFSLGA